MNLKVLGTFNLLSFSSRILLKNIEMWKWFDKDIREDFLTSDVAEMLGWPRAWKDIIR